MSYRVRWGWALASLVIGTALACAETAGREIDILKRTGESYRGLKSYVITGSIHVDLKAGERSQTMDAPIVIAAVAPGRMRDEIRHAQMGSIIVSNGKQQWQYYAQVGQYTTAVVEEPPGDTVAVSSSLSGNVLPSYRALAADVKSAKIVREETLSTADGQRKCWVIEVEYDREPTNASMTDTPKTYWIDQQRHVVLRHRVGVRTQNPQGGAVEQTETMSYEHVALNAGAPDSLFTFVAPAGAKEVQSFRPQGSQHADLSGQEASDFTLADLTGKKHRLKDQRGRVVMLDFWATWCGPCRMQMPNVDKLHKEYKGKGLVVYAINEQESAEKARRYLERFKYTTTTLLDSDGEVGNQYKVTGIPSLVVIDRQGKIAAHLVGVHSEADLRKALKKGGLAMDEPVDSPVGPGRR